jgi:hypothetical protein
MKALVVVIALWWSTPLAAYSLVSFQYIALTGNAGGQNAYALSLAQNNTREFGLFVNQHLSTGKIPLSGATYSLRYLLSPDYYVLTSFVQLGGGISTAGPLLALTWNITALQVVRIDMTTHIYFPQIRPLIWNYPLWLGITLPV